MYHTEPIQQNSNKTMPMYQSIQVISLGRADLSLTGLNL